MTSRKKRHATHRRVKARPQKGSLVVTVTPQVWQLYKDTVAKKLPETYAILGGSLDDPFTVTEFRFCPPQRNRHGRYDVGNAHVSCDADYMNFVIDHEWRPNGKDILGIWHSHPPGCTNLSTGNSVSNEGDIAFFTSCLENDDSPNENWNNFLAPITTFDRYGNDIVTTWVLEKGSRTPRSARIRVSEKTFEMQDIIPLPDHGYLASPRKNVLFGPDKDLG